MSLAELAQIASILEAIVVVISLIFIYLQLRQSNELARAEKAQSLVEHAGNFNLLLAQNPDLIKLWYSHGKTLESEVDLQRYRELLIQWIILHENVFYQHQKGLLDDSVYSPWQQDLKYTVQNHNMELIAGLKDVFAKEFGEHIIRLGNER